MIINPLKVWVQNVLPVVYDDSLSYLEVIAQINAKTNEIITQTNENTNTIETLAEAIAELGDIEELRALLDEVETIINDLYTTDLPIMDGTASAGSADHAARSDHVHPSDTNRAPVNHASADDQYGAGSANNYGHVKLTDNINNANTGTAITPSAVKNFVKPNLLDNWYFVGGGSQQGGGQFPINQQELTIYTGQSNILDRWILRNTAITASILPEYLKIDFPANVSNFAQRVNLEAGRLYTISVLTDSGLIYGTGAPSASENTEIFRSGNFAFRFWDNIGIMITSLVANATINIKAIKLEVGSEQTLAHQESGIWVLNELPNYFDELAKCQKYLVRYKAGAYLFNAISASNGANLEFSLPIFMKRGVVSISGSPGIVFRVAGTQRTINQYISATQGQLGEINLTYSLSESAPANETGAAWVNANYLDVFIDKEV